MKRTLLAILASLCTMGASAQLPTDGFYRIQNYASGRYLYVTDNRGSINIQGTTADLVAIQLWQNYERTISDPATVVYVKNAGGNDFRFHSQGTDTYAITGYNLKLAENRGKYKGTFKAYQSANGMTKYLADANPYTDIDEGWMGTNDTGTALRYWNILPISAATDQYFGITPTHEAGGIHYASFFAEFGFKLYSAGMKAYYVKKVERGMAVIEEIKNGEVPGATPVLISCASVKPSENRLELLNTKVSLPSANRLGGNYFYTPNNGPKHTNVTPNNQQTMRLLDVSAEGYLVYKKSDLKHLPANTAYLKVPAGSPDELRVVTQKEFDEIIASGIDGAVSLDAHDESIYTISGHIVGQGRKALQHLPSGVYIMGGQKFVVK